MFKNFFFSELKYAFKQPMVYIFLLLITLLAFGATVSDNITIGGSVGNIYKNAPHIITVYSIIITLFGTFIATAFFNNAALKDYNHQFNEILFSTPLSKPGYFFGRFFSALILSTIPILGVYLGVILGSFIGPLAGWIAPDRFGDFYLQTFISNYFIFILPNMFVVGSVIFALASKWKNTIISFIGSLIIFLGYQISGELISNIDNETIAALVDTFGFRTYNLYSKYFTPIEKNTLSPSFSGLILLNRIAWIGISSIILILSYFSFSFKEKSKKVKKEKKKKITNTSSFKLPELVPLFSKKTTWIQFKSFFYLNFLSILKSITFKVLSLFSVILLFQSLAGGFEYYGLQSYPVTYKMIDIIHGITDLFLLIILVFFSGELIWRDRQSHINEVIDATPHTSLISLAAKGLSLITTLTLLNFFLIVCGLIYQLANGYTRLELNVYLLDFFFRNFPTFITWSAIMIMIQVFSSNKYIGYFISILLLFTLTLLLSIFDIESKMLALGDAPSISYSDMNSFGPGLKGLLWFKTYWIFFSLICLLIAGAFWNRGTIGSFKDKIKSAKKQIPKSFRLTIYAIVVCWLAVTGFVYYNTQILNSYDTSDELEQLMVDYEKKYKKYEDATLPKINDVNYFIDIFPKKRNVFVTAKMELINESRLNIDSIFYTLDKNWKTKINLPNSTLVTNDKDSFHIYKLSKPLKPNDTINIEITSEYLINGFENYRGNTKIIANGTFLNNYEILPYLGYNSRFELNDNNTRKKYDLKQKQRMPKLSASCTSTCMKNYLSNGTADYINAETIISTSNDQIAIAPGSLVKKWKENDRNYFHYKLDHPSQHFHSFTSAKFELKTRKWNGIDIEVYYDAKHYKNIDNMLTAVERSLKYYTENFGPYMHKQCRIIEFPRYRTLAQAFPGTMPYSESFGFITNLEDDTKNNVVDKVISHEMAHQWWAHQVIGSNMQGATMFSESFAEYSSLMTMKSTAKTPMKMTGFLKHEYDRYLRGRSQELQKELPLYKVENQQYIHYQKGSVIMYALQDYIGEEKVNTAMREFLEEYKYKKAPYPTSLDFMKYLEPKVPDSLNYIIKDWFKEITLYDNRMKEASYKKLKNGKYQISMKIESKKLKADTIGNETQVAINDWVDVGAFSDKDEEQLVFEKRVKINKPEMDFTFEIDSLPAKLAVDPRMLLIDRVYKDNIKAVTEISVN